MNLQNFLDRRALVLHLALPQRQRGLPLLQLFVGLLQRPKRRCMVLSVLELFSQGSVLLLQESHFVGWGPDLGITRTAW